MDKKVRRIKAKIRKLTWLQKVVLMDWINTWYSDYKEQQKLEWEQWCQMEEE